MREHNAAVMAPVLADLAAAVAAAAAVDDTDY